jgi:hypothetical protein
MMLQDITNLPPYQLRVIEERAQLNEKIGKLATFFTTDAFRALPTEARDLLMEQHVVMLRYSNILFQRIACFGAATPIDPIILALSQFENALVQLTFARDGQGQRVRLAPQEFSSEALRATTREFMGTFLGEGGVFVAIEEGKIKESQPAEIAAWTNLALLAHATAAAIRAGQ